MTTTLTIGRCALSEPPEQMSWNGDVLSMSGDIVADSYAELTAIRGQLSGLADNPDEQVVPVTFTEDSTIDGFYAVESVSVGSTPTMISTFVAPWSVSLRKIRQPLFETFSTVVLRTNAHTITGTPNTIMGCYPNATSQEVVQSGDVLPGAFQRTGTDGLIDLADSSLASTYPGSGTIAFCATPATHYAGRPFLEVKGADDTYRKVIGRQVPSNAAGRWRISNGLCRIYPGSTAGHFTVEVYDAVAAAWEGTQFLPGYDPSPGWSGGTLGYSPSNATYATPTVIRNGLDDVTIRFATTLAPGNVLSGTTDVSLTAGAHFVTIRATSKSAVKWGFGVSTPAAATTAVAGALIANADSAAGNRWIMMSAEAADNDTTNGRRTLTTAATSCLFGIGIILGGGTSTLLDEQFYGASIMSTRAVAK